MPDREQADYEYIDAFALGRRVAKMPVEPSSHFAALWAHRPGFRQGYDGDPA